MHFDYGVSRDPRRNPTFPTLTVTAGEDSMTLEYHDSGYHGGPSPELDVGRRRRLILAGSRVLQDLVDEKRLGVIRHVMDGLSPVVVRDFEDTLPQRFSDGSEMMPAHCDYHEKPQ